MQTNKKKVKTPVAKKTTHGGAVAVDTSKLNELRRSVLASMLWEDSFYEDGKSHADRITTLANQLDPALVAQVAVEARTQQKLRHVPLRLLSSIVQKASGTNVISTALPRVIQRADELAEFLAMYWADGRKPIAKQVKVGLAEAFKKFDAYQLAKYNREGKSVTLRDVMFMVRPKPVTLEQAETWKQLANGTLASPDTWEVNLSAGANKRDTFERLLKEGKLGYLALLRNLRNMEQAGVSDKLIREAILARKGGADNVLPFRYFAAAKAAPRFEDALDQAMVASLAQVPKLPGKTVVVVDVSGSMNANLSAKSDMTRLTAACSLAAILREVCEHPVIYATAGNDGTRVHQTALVPARRGIALADAIGKMMYPLGGGGIFLKQVMDYVAAHEHGADRVIVITDEQDCGIGAGQAPAQAQLFAPRNYMLNVATYENGIGYGKWTHIDGFSENVVRWMVEYEQLQ